jgi:hypothetical protein
MIKVYHHMVRKVARDAGASLNSSGQSFRISLKVACLMTYRVRAYLVRRLPVTFPRLPGSPFSSFLSDSCPDLGSRQVIQLPLTK